MPQQDRTGSLIVCLLFGTDEPLALRRFGTSQIICICQLFILFLMRLRLATVGQTISRPSRLPELLLRKGGTEFLVTNNRC